MQMLAAGGLPVLSDGVRAADEDNLRGYFEWEPARRLPKEPQLIAEAEGKVVKVVSSLLAALQRSREYRIVFVERPVAEVVASQAAMIQRRGTTGAALPPAALAAALQAHRNQVVTWIRQQPNLALLQVEYHKLLADPAPEATGMRDFLGLVLDTEAMARQVDPALYRRRAGGQTCE